MKYLKKYNEAKLSKLDDVLYTIEDICIDLEDIGYQVFTSTIINIVKIRKIDESPFNLMEIIDSLNRVNLYLELENMKMCGIKIRSGHKTKSMKDYKRVIKWASYGIHDTKYISFKIEEVNT